MWQGTSDMTAWLSVPACLSVLGALQPQEVAHYNHGLVKQATALLQQAWGTQLVLGLRLDGSSAGMVAVQLPWPLYLHQHSSNSNGYSSDPSAAVTSKTSSSTASHAVYGSCKGLDGSASRAEAQEGGHDAGKALTGPTSADATALNKLLRECYKIEVPVACVEGKLFCRISAQIYNSMEDYARIADVVCRLRFIEV